MNPNAETVGAIENGRDWLKKQVIRNAKNLWLEPQFMTVLHEKCLIFSRQSMKSLLQHCGDFRICS